MFTHQFQRLSPGCYMPSLHNRVSSRQARFEQGLQKKCNRVTRALPQARAPEFTPRDWRLVYPDPTNASRFTCVNIISGRFHAWNIKKCESSRVSHIAQLDWKRYCPAVWTGSWSNLRAQFIHTLRILSRGSFFLYWLHKWFTKSFKTHYPLFIWRRYSHILPLVLILVYLPCQ